MTPDHPSAAASAMPCEVRSLEKAPDTWSSGPDEDLGPAGGWRLAAQARQVTAQRTGPAPHIQRLLPAADPRQIGEPHGQRFRISPHELRVGVRADIEAHQVNLPATHSAGLSGCLTRGSAGGFFPDRDVLAALAREGLPGPPVPPLAQSQPGELGHQVELGRPHVPEGDRGVFATAAGDLDVV